MAYDAEGRGVDHAIDVQSLAPALLAFGKLIREANAEINGKQTTARVRVVSDFEHRCFNINFEVIVGYLEKVKTLLETTPAQSAKHILEWLGLIAGTGFVTYLKYLQWKNGRKVVSTKTISGTEHSGLVEVKVDGDSNSIHVHSHVYNLSENSRALRATRDAFLPLGQDGFDTLRVGKAEEATEIIAPHQVDAIIASCNLGIEQSAETEPEVEITPAWLSVYSPVYDLAAQKWRFRLGKEVIYADISETNIAEEALKRGSAFADDAYQVKLQITTNVDSSGKKHEPEHKIIEVIRFVPAAPPARQQSFFDDLDS